MVTHSTRDCVVSAAYNVGPDYVNNFVRSFRKYNRSARMIMLVANTEPLADYAREFDIELRRNTWIERTVPCINMPKRLQRVRLTEAIGRTNPIVPRLSFMFPDKLMRVLVSLSVARYFHVREVLASETMGRVLLSDSRDVFFQADPFAGDFELEFADERNKYGECPYNDKWIRVGFGPDVYRHMLGKSVYCAGTILGRHDRLLQHVTRICDVVRKLRSWRCFGQDQGVHNYIIHHMLKPGEYTVSTNDRGRIVTLGPEKNPRCVDGWMVQDNGEPFAIVHQYDRLKVPVRQSLKILQELGTSAVKF